MKTFHYRVLRSYESSKFETWYTHGQLAVVSCIPESEPVTSLDRFYKFPLMKKKMFLFSRTVKITKLKPGTLMESRLMYLLYQIHG